LAIKIPFFVLGLFWLALSFLQNRNLTRLLVSVIFCSVLLCAYFLITSINPMEMIADYTLPASLRVENVLFTPATLEKKFSWIPFFPTLAIASLSIAALYLYEKQWLQAVLAFSIIGGELLLHLINNGNTDIPLLTLLAMQALNRLPGRPWASYITIAVITLNTGYFAWKNLEGFEQARLLVAQKDTITPINAGNLHNLYVIREAGIESRDDYEGELMEGVNLIRSHISKPEHIATLGPINPFNVLLKSTPPRYMPVAWQYNYTFSNTLFPEYKKTFSDTDIILIPKAEDIESTTALKKIYGDNIAKDFKQIADSSRWILWQRNH
jgi:hypothetical protein